MKQELTPLWYYENENTDEYIECYKNIVTLDNGMQLSPSYEVSGIIGEWFREWDFDTEEEAFERGVLPFIDENWKRTE